MLGASLMYQSPYRHWDLVHQHRRHQDGLPVRFRPIIYRSPPLAIPTFSAARLAAPPKEDCKEPPQSSYLGGASRKGLNGRGLRQ